MIRSKIDPSTVKDLAWKDYAKLFEKDVKQAQDKGVEKVPLIMVSDFTFCLWRSTCFDAFRQAVRNDQILQKSKNRYQQKKTKRLLYWFLPF